MKRIILTGPSGSGRKEAAAKLKDQFKMVHIDMTALIKLELAKKNDNAKEIFEAVDNH